MTTCSFIKTVSKCDSQLKVMIERMQRGSDGVQCDWTLFHLAMRAAGTLFELVFVNSEFKSHYSCKLC